MADVQFNQLPINTTVDGTVSVVCVKDNGNGTFTDAKTAANLLGATPSLTSTYIAYGDSSNQLTGSSDFTWDGSTMVLSSSGNPKVLFSTIGAINYGNIGTGNNAKFEYNWDGLHINASFSEGGNLHRFFVIDAINGIYGLGDGATSSTPINHGTNITINDAVQLIKITNVPAYANDSAAISGGLTTGNLYKKTVAGVTQLCIVP